MKRILLILLAAFLAACTNPFFEDLLGLHDDGGTAVYTVTFNTGGGTPAPEAQTVSSGGTVGAPPAMTKTGRVFGGWYRDAAFTVPWNFTADTVTEDMTLYARWINTYTLSFNANGGTPVPPAQTVAGGDTAAAPPAPAKTDFSFGGWYRDAAFTAPWNFAADTVTANITLYARWNPGAAVQIILRPEDDPALSNESVFEDEAASFTAAGGGYTAWQWYWDGAPVGSGTPGVYNLAAGSQAPGIYEVSVVVYTGGGETLSARCRLTIKAR